MVKFIGAGPGVFLQEAGQTRRSNNDLRESKKLHQGSSSCGYTVEAVIWFYSDKRFLESSDPVKNSG